mgnify:CR=1 FL=1
MKFDLKNAILSYVDTKQGLILPTEPSKELAEMIGILAGDGHVKYYPTSNDYYIEVCGHAEDDIDYLNNVSLLFYRLFHLKMHFQIKHQIRTAYITRRSKGVYNFLRIIGYKKVRCIMDIPNWIWESEEFAKSFARGLFDTDGSIALKKNNYPVVSIVLKDGKTISKLAQKIRILGIPICVSPENTFDKRTGKYYKKTRLQVSGRNNVGLWFKLIGSSNPKHNKKWGGRDIQGNTPI